MNHVENHVGLPQQFSATILADRIKDALARNAALAARNINVSVQGDRVTLSGYLPSWLEKKQAGLAAWAAPHVGSVQNNITIGLE